MRNKITSFSFTLRFTDLDAFNVYAQQQPRYRPTNRFQDTVINTMLAPAAPPEMSGFRICYAAAKAENEKDWRIDVSAEVFNEAHMREEAQDRHAICWQDTNWQPESNGEALFEILVASSANHSHIGGLIINYDFIMSDCTNDSQDEIQAPAFA